MSDFTVSITGKKVTANRLDIKARQFEFISDKELDFGGNEDGPNPLEYLLGGYAACINVVAHMVAKEQNINVRKLEISITGTLDASRLFGQSKKARAGFKSLKVNLNLDSDADQATQERWIKEVEERCPAGDNLANATPIEIVTNQLASVN